MHVQLILLAPEGHGYVSAEVSARFHPAGQPSERRSLSAPHSSIDGQSLPMTSLLPLLRALSISFCVVFPTMWPLQTSHLKFQRPRRGARDIRV